MNQAETQLKQLLERSRQQLIRPFSNVQRRLLYLINLAYLLLTPVFLVSERVATGSYVPDERLWLVYGFVWLTNLMSALYADLRLRGSKPPVFGKHLNLLRLNDNPRIEKTLRWTSVLSVMLMSLANLVGIGNPSTDSLLTDFALAHSLIMLSAMILGRMATLIWSGVVVEIPPISGPLKN